MEFGEGHFFQTGYIIPMDKDYGGEHLDDTGTNDFGVAPIRDVGFSVPLGIAAMNVPGVAAKIRTGTRLIEIQFPGAGRAQRNAQTPGVYGEMQRQALEELGRANNVDFTTHASFSVMGLAGMDQQGNFSKQNKKFALEEIERAITFAADVARGGNVTIHTGEFVRPISEEKWAIDPETGKHMFKNFQDEDERAIFRVVDERNGQIAAQIRKNQNVARPVWLTAKQGETYFDENGAEQVVSEDNQEKIYINYDRKIVTKLVDREPEYYKEGDNKGRFKTEYWDWAKFEKEAAERTADARRFWRENKDNPDAWRGNNPYMQFREKTSEEDIVVSPEVAYMWATLEINAANARGWALYYGGQMDQLLDRKKKLERARELFEKIEKGVPEEEKWQLLREARDARDSAGIIPPEYKLTTEIIDDQLYEVRRSINYSKESSLSQEQQAADAYETMRNILSQKDYALKESFDSYAQAGLRAMAETNRLEREKKLKQPLFVAMEHIFPEQYGGHPDELIELVEGGRKSMVQKLLKLGKSEEEAQRLAETHIKGHLDTGHINMWRKYWQWNDNLTPEENDRKFNTWVLDHVEKMAAKHMIGSVHLTDNDGYQDEHLSPGQGNAPVVDMIKILKKHGFDGALVVEPGADATTDLSDFHGLMKTWKLFGSSIYGIGSGQGATTRQRAWGDVQYGFFGQMESPYFVFGGYSPSEDWTLWSGVKME